MIATLKKNVAAVKSTVADNFARAAVATVAALGTVAASAQTTDPFDTAVAAMTTKVGGYGAALVGFAAVSVGFMIAIKYVKKIPRSA